MSRGAPFQLTARLDPKEFARYQKKLAKNAGKPLIIRAERLTLAAARYLVPIGRRLAPIGEARIIRGELIKPGNLRSRIKPKALRRRAFEPMRPVWFGSSAWYAHMVPGGTTPHSVEPIRAGKSEFAAFGVDEVRPLSAFPTHPGAKPVPWVDETWREGGDDYMRVVERDIFDTR